MSGGYKWPRSARRVPNKKHRFRAGDVVRALDVSLTAEVKRGGRYVVESHDSLDDGMGYLRLEGVSEFYRPYLFEPVTPRLAVDPFSPGALAGRPCAPPVKPPPSTAV
jgi:hypothetical protein